MYIIIASLFFLIFYKFLPQLDMIVVASLAGRSDSAGNTPLHLAAQHGNLAATALLLRSGCDVNGRGGGEGGSSSKTINSSSRAATPLHRASFSGTTSCMRLLLEDPRCDLMVPDTSFGDNMTPLHKSASGGRYLAVQLLIEALRSRNLLADALSSKDAEGRTPLDVAIEKQKNKEEASLSVARWNAVAGGQPDWDKCAELLSENSGESAGKTSVSRLLSSSRPKELMQSNFDCTDCNEGGNCLTASWEAAFQKALFSSVGSTLHQQQPTDSDALASPASPTKRVTSSDRESQLAGTESSVLSEGGGCDNRPSPIGKECDICHSISYALFRREGLRVCKKCRRKK